jgi:hypothetical protein
MRKKSTKKLWLLFATLFAGTTAATAQCSFTVSINEAVDYYIGICPNTPLILSTQPGFDGYQWYMDGVAIAGANSDSLILTQGDVEIEVEATLAGCTEKSDGLLIYSYNFIMPSIGLGYPNVNASPYQLVPGDSTILKAIMNMGSGSQYKWFKDGNLLAGETAQNLVVRDAGVYTLQQAPEDCPSYFMNAGVGVEVVMCNGQGIKPIIVQSNDTLYSPNTTIYRWANNLSGSMVSNNSFFVPTAAGAYYLASIDKDGCQVISEPYHFSLNANCNFTPVINNGDEVALLCPYGQVELQTQQYNTYQWYRDGVAMPGETSQSLEIDEEGVSFMVYVKNNGCGKISNSVFVDGLWFALPTIGFDRATIDLPVFYLVPGDSIGLTAATYLGDGSKYKWFKNGDEILGETERLFTVKQPGFYGLMQAPEICPSFYMFSGVEVQVEFCTSPVEKPVISQNGNTLVASGGTYYYWSFGLNGTIIAMAPTMLPQDTGYYYVATINQDGCQILSEPFFYPESGAGISPKPDGIAINIYPNPVREKLHIEVTDTGSFNYNILSSYGKVILSGKEVAGGMATIDTSELSAGVYFVQVISGNQVQSKKIIIAGN